MCLAASAVIAGHVKEADLAPDNVLPTPLDPELCPVVAEAVAAQAAAEGLARKPYQQGAIAKRVREFNQFSGRQQDYLRALNQ